MRAIGLPPAAQFVETVPALVLTSYWGPDCLIRLAFGPSARCERSTSVDVGGWLATGAFAAAAAA